MSKEHEIIMIGSAVAKRIQSIYNTKEARNYWALELCKIILECEKTVGLYFFTIKDRDKFVKVLKDVNSQNNFFINASSFIKNYSYVDKNVLRGARLDELWIVREER